MKTNPSTSSRRCLVDVQGEAIPALDRFLDYLAELIAAQRIAEIQEAVPPPIADCRPEQPDLGQVRDSSSMSGEEGSRRRPMPTPVAVSEASDLMDNCSD